MIRKATSDDIASLQSIADNPPAYFERCIRERDVLIISAQDGRDAGYAMLNRMPHYTLYRRLGAPEIQDVHVMPAYRQQGLAQALIRHCETVAKAEHCSHIGVSVALHAGFGPAQRLYFKMGYAPDGFGVTYDRDPVTAGEFRPVDDNLCLMLIRAL